MFGITGRFPRRLPRGARSILGSVTSLTCSFARLLDAIGGTVEYVADMPHEVRVLRPAEGAFERLLREFGESAHEVLHVLPEKAIRRVVDALIDLLHSLIVLLEEAEAFEVTE